MKSRIFEKPQISCDKFFKTMTEEEHREERPINPKENLPKKSLSKCPTC
jgi:hypothetical protein